MSRIRVLIVDDHALFRRGLAEVLSEEEDLEIVAQAADGAEAVKKAMDLAPDVIIMDLNMRGLGGIETTSYLLHQRPSTNVLVLTVSEQAADLFRALSVGARGYVLKSADPQEIVDALRQVHQGWVVVSPAMAPRLISELGQVGAAIAGAADRAAADDSATETQLTTREQEVLQRLSRRLTNADIAGEMVLSENTVKTHIKNILSKLHFKNRAQATEYALRLELRIAELGSHSPDPG